MNIDKLETDGKISKVKLLHDCAGTLRTFAALKNSLDKSAASVTKKHQALQNAQQQDLQGTNVTATLFNYQKALAAAERHKIDVVHRQQAAEAHHQAVNG